MSCGKSIQDPTSNGSGQFSKFSINKDRPAKRRRNTKNAEAGPSSIPIVPTSSQTEKVVEKSKDGIALAAPRSCAECKRMKLKCDRIFPCRTCVRRGLEGICPEGSLVTGRGTRYLLASTEKLHEKILTMAERIRTLEEALGTIHREHANCRPCSCHPNPKQDGVTQPHPLLRSDLLLIKGQLELYGLEAPKGLAEGNGDSSSERPFCPESTPSSHDLPKVTVHPASSDKKETGGDVDADDRTLHMLEAKRKLSPSEDLTENERLRNESSSMKRQRHEKETAEERGRRLRAMMPPREEAEHLAREAIWNGAWILNFTSRPADRAELLHKLYDGPLEDIRPQQVALALAAFAIGAQVDIGPADRNHSAPVGNNSARQFGHFNDGLLGGDKKEYTEDIKESEKLRRGTGRRNSRTARESYNLSKAALGEVSVEGEADQTVVHCLYLLTWYLAALTDVKDAGREVMVVVNLAVKIAFQIGMHLEETYKGLSAEEQQERRILFWAVLHVESRLRLDSDRRGALGTMDITTKRPFASIPGAIKSFPTQAEAIYHDYKLEFLESCIVPALEMIARAPKLRLREHDYYDVLALDRRIRDFEIPPILSQPIGAPLPPESFETLPTSSPTSLNFILNPSTQVSPFNLSYGRGMAPRNVQRMIRAKAQQEKLITLLYLHRAFFYAHIRDHRPLVQRRFLPSAIASFSAACSLILTAKEVYKSEPELAVRVSVLWYNAFLAATSLFMLIVYKPFCPVSVLAIQELEKARSLFLTASTKCHMAARSYPILRQFYAKASEISKRWHEESEGNMGVFGPNGEVVLCQTRIDIVIERLQSTSIPSPEEEDATTGLLSLKKHLSTSSSSTSEETSGEFLGTSCSTTKTNEGCDDLFYDMWQYVHKELADFVKRIPEVLKDAAVDPRRATAARLIWGFVPIPGETKSEDADDSPPMEEPQLELGLPSNLDWNAFTDALMHAPTVQAQSANIPLAHFGYPSPPPTAYSPDGSQSSFGMLDIPAGIESSIPVACCKPGDTSGYAADVPMDGTMTMFGRDEILIVESSENDLRKSSFNDSASGILRGKYGSGLGDEPKNGHSMGSDGNDEHRLSMASGSTESDNGTLGYLWKHRTKDSPYLSSAAMRSSHSASSSRHISVGFGMN